MTTGSGLDRVTGPIRDAAWADMDGDGDPDLLLARDQGGLLLLQDRPLHWQPAQGSGLETWPEPWLTVHVADIDGDGDGDLLATGPDGDRLYRNDGSGRLAPEPGPLGFHRTPGATCFLDFDGDGDPDLLAVPGPEAAPAAAAELAAPAAGGRPAGTTAVLLRNEGGLFGPWPGGREPAPVLAAGALACADADGDGRAEAWVASDDDGRDLFLPHRLLAGAGPLAASAAGMPSPVLPGRAAVWLPAAPGRPATVALLTGSRRWRRPRLVLLVTPASIPEPAAGGS